MTYMVAISGSRHYISGKKWRVHDAIAQEHRAHDDVLFLVGDCPDGVDKFALSFLTTAGWNFKRFNADWTKYGNAAGPIRNKEMIDWGADKLIAFPEDDSRGTKDCAKYAKSVGVKVVFPDLPYWAKWAASLATFEDEDDSDKTTKQQNR